jgi:hypothetical protein
MGRKKKTSVPEDKTGKETELVQEPENIIVPVHRDDLRKEIDEVEHIVRMVNIKHNSPGVTTIKKVVVYDCKLKKLIKADYIVGVK